MAPPDSIIETTPMPPLEPRALCSCNWCVKKALVVAAGALAIAPNASAKVCVTVAVRPSHPVLGQRVQVQLATWMPEWSGSRAHFGHYVGLPTRDALRVQVVSPQKASFSIHLRRDSMRPWLWRGRLGLRERGRWTLAPDQRRWAYAPQTCAATLRLDVK
jgi:hypothetical protein